MIGFNLSEVTDDVLASLERSIRLQIDKMENDLDVVLAEKHRRTHNPLFED